MARLFFVAALSILGISARADDFVVKPLPILASGIFEVPRDAGIDLRWSRSTPEDIVVLSAGGNTISFCPPLSCVRVPTTDHQRATALFAATTRDDGHSEEQTVAILTSVKTGEGKKWTPNTKYTDGDNVISSTDNAVYRAVAGGLSSPSGHGPSGKGSDIEDGSVRWRWINDAAIDAKVGLYNELATYAHGGASWGQANNVHLQPGATPTFNVNTELDFVNDAKNCEFAIADCNDLLVSIGGTKKSTTGLYVVSGNSSNFAAHWGLRLAGRFLASDEDVEDDADAPVAIGISATGTHKHSIASILDGSEGPVSYQIKGNHSVATIEDQSTSPASLSIGGKHSIAGIVEQSQSQNGIALNGTYKGAQIIGKGFEIGPSGDIQGQTVEAVKRIILPLGSPSPGSSCVPGQAAVSTEYMYVCVAANRWMRVQLQKL